MLLRSECKLLIAYNELRDLYQNFASTYEL